MANFPVMLKLTGRRCVIVGGGGVAHRRAAALLEAGAAVTVIAPAVEDKLAALPVSIERRAYRRGDLDGARLVVIATDDPAVNRRVAEDAAAAGVLVNRTDDPDAGDVAVPAHGRHGAVTIAVDTAGISAAAAATIRRQLSEKLDPDWPRLLEAVAPYREQVRQRIADRAERQVRLRRLTDEQAMNILKAQGTEALRRHCEALLREET
ncbi:MAG: precorrin-2 dehydrogenase/sirohydrochlorin ferrochelatase family protein [Phycisphaeraceae bacterium]